MASTIVKCRYCKLELIKDYNFDKESDRICKNCVVEFHNGQGDARKIPIVSEAYFRGYHDTIIMKYGNLIRVVK